MRYSSILPEVLKIADLAGEKVLAIYKTDFKVDFKTDESPSPLRIWQVTTSSSTVCGN